MKRCLLYFIKFGHSEVLPVVRRAVTGYENECGSNLFHKFEQIVKTANHIAFGLFDIHTPGTMLNIVATFFFGLLYAFNLISNRALRKLSDHEKSFSYHFINGHFGDISIIPIIRTYKTYGTLTGRHR
ncbi:hypothetical protein BDC45DRAFT_530305 [Circinella umbellata]|nr:hypothetical protein BDC45DRAFT_530305 [Circinella umbellata]